MSASYRLKKPDRRFEELKTYSNDVQTHITSILRIRAVSTKKGEHIEAISKKSYLVFMIVTIF